LGYSITALAPQRMGLGPVSATQDLLSSFNVKMNQLAAVELNEAFAAQVIACQRTLKISEDKLNPRGGAIALGHPIGATGARITTTLVHQIKASEQGLGLATLCVSGGMGFSLLLRAV